VSSRGEGEKTTISTITNTPKITRKRDLKRFLRENIK